MNTYKKPVVTVDAGMAEGVYAASGATQGTLNVTYHGVWDRWGTNGGKGLAMANWSDLNGTITLNINFNDTVDQAETAAADAGVVGLHHRQGQGYGGGGIKGVSALPQDITPPARPARALPAQPGSCPPRAAQRIRCPAGGGRFR